MNGFLEFDCNAECGEKILVYVGDQPKNLPGDPMERRERMYSWLGELVWLELVAHHVGHCTECYKQPDGTPWLRLVQ